MAELTIAQQMMVQDGMPPELFKTEEERAAYWREHPPKASKLTDLRIPATSTDAEAFAKAEAERKRLKDYATVAKRKIKKETPDPNTHHWDTVYGLWVPNVIYKPEDKMRPDFNSLNGPGLIQAHNEMAIEAAGLELPVQAVKRFKTLTVGIRRCEELYKSLCAKKGIEYEPATVPQANEAEATSSEGDTEMSTTKTKAKKATKKPAKKTAKKAAKKATVAKKPAKEKLPISAAFNVRNGTKHEDILVYLSHADRIKKQWPAANIIKAVYGDPEKFAGAFNIRIKDLMKKRAKGFEIKREAVEEKGGFTYGLYTK